MKKPILLIFACCLSHFTFAQDDLMQMIDEGSPKNEPVIATFKTTRVINAHSVETVKGKTLDFRVTHRFGDIGGTSDIHNFYGLYNIQDVRISFEYGITDKLTVALGKSKFLEFMDGYLKYRLLQQTTDNKKPVAVTFFVNTAVTGIKASPDSTSEFSYQETTDRMSFTTQFIIARKFGDYFSLELLPTYLHRNYVAFEDENSFFAVGIGGRIKFSKSAALICDYFYNLSKYRQDNNYIYYNPLAVGLEIETGGHVFHLTFTNSEGIIENAFLPHTRKSWLNGEFRWGFNISRVFSVGKR